MDRHLFLAQFAQLFVLLHLWLHHLALTQFAIFQMILLASSGLVETIGYYLCFTDEDSLCLLLGFRLLLEYYLVVWNLFVDFGGLLLLLSLELDVVHLLYFLLFYAARWDVFLQVV